MRNEPLLARYPVAPEESKSMRSILLLFLVLVCSTSLACRSGAKHDDVPCTCGTPEADFHGCAHHLCLAGQRNPENPDCVCGTLTIPK